MLMSRDDTIQLGFLDPHGELIIFDTYGFNGTKNDGTIAEFTNGRAERLESVRAPSVEFNSEEWNITLNNSIFVVPSPNYDPGGAGPSGCCLEIRSSNTDVKIANCLAQSRILGWRS